MKDLKKEFLKLGINIKKFRNKHNITIKELSQKTGIRIKYLQKIEKGDAFGLKICTHLLKISNALDIKIYELFQ